MPADPNRARDIFLAALELSPDDRPAYLADQYGEDADLRAEVDRLLAANADPDSILEPETRNPGTDLLPDRASATQAFEPDCADSHGDCDRGAPARRGDADASRRRLPARRPRQPASSAARGRGSRGAKGSAALSPAGTRWSR